MLRGPDQRKYGQLGHCTRLGRISTTVTRGELILFQSPNLDFQSVCVTILLYPSATKLQSQVLSFMCIIWERPSTKIRTTDWQFQQELQTTCSFVSASPAFEKDFFLSQLKAHDNRSAQTSLRSNFRNGSSTILFVESNVLKFTVLLCQLLNRTIVSW